MLNTASLRALRLRKPCPAVAQAQPVATARLHTHALRDQAPARLICAVPVAARDSLARVRPLADDVVCLSAPPDFHAVGQYYENFAQIEDDEVIATLNQARVTAQPPGR
jgi:putative phosphoribosyl transferase